jgi:hypothetical protein
MNKIHITRTIYVRLNFKNFLKVTLTNISFWGERKQIHTEIVTIRAQRCCCWRYERGKGIGLQLEYFQG